MGKEIEDLYRKALNLSLDDRATLAGKLMGSLAQECKSDPDGKWRDGMLDRIAANDRDAEKLIAWEDAKRRARKPGKS